MLYVTTRISDDAFTAHRALTEDRGPEGGLYVPMRDPLYTREQILTLKDKSFSENVADVMNLLFHRDVDGWAVEFAIGRYPLRMASLSGKVIAAELWHNPQWQFERVARNLTRLVLKSEEDRNPSNWMMIGTRIAMLFGIYGELVHGGQLDNGGILDVVVPSFDFAPAMAAWFARRCGLPIGNIVVCCNENNQPWGLIRHGQLKTDAVAVRTDLNKCDHAVAPDLERLVYCTLGAKEARRFCEVCRKGGNYILQDHQLNQLRDGIWVSVVSQHRTEAMISGIYKSAGYIAEPYTALAYSGLMDYRAQTGESGLAVILSEESPAFYLDMVSGCLGIPRKALKERIDRS